MSEWVNVGPGHHERDYGQGYAGTLKMIPSAPLGQLWEWSVRLGDDTLETGYRSSGSAAGEAADECARAHMAPQGYAALAGIGAGYEYAIRRSIELNARDLRAIRLALARPDDDPDALSLADMAASVASAMHGERQDRARQVFDDSVRHALGQAAALGQGDES